MAQVMGRPFPNRVYPWRREDTDPEAVARRYADCQLHPEEAAREIERLRADLVALEALAFPAVTWAGWAVDRPGSPLFVDYCATEADAWRIALGWPDAEEIEHAKANGARAFPVEIRERPR